MRIAPPLLGWGLLAAGLAVGSMATFLAGFFGMRVGARDGALCQDMKESLQGGLIVRLPDGRTAWIAPPRDTTVKRTDGSR